MKADPNDTRLGLNEHTFGRHWEGATAGLAAKGFDMNELAARAALTMAEQGNGLDDAPPDGMLFGDEHYRS